MQRADRILVFEEGRVEEGKHEMLVWVYERIVRAGGLNSLAR